MKKLISEISIKGILNSDPITPITINYETVNEISDLKIDMLKEFDMPIWIGDYISCILKIVNYEKNDISAQIKEPINQDIAEIVKDSISINGQVMEENYEVDSSGSLIIGNVVPIIIEKETTCIVKYQLRRVKN